MADTIVVHGHWLPSKRSFDALLGGLSADKICRWDEVIAGSLYVFLDYIPLCLSCFEACLCAVFEAGTHGTGERSVTKP